MRKAILHAEPSSKWTAPPNAYRKTDAPGVARYNLHGANGDRAHRVFERNEEECIVKTRLTGQQPFRTD